MSLWDVNLVVGTKAFLNMLSIFGEKSKFPFCDHKQTTKDDKRR